MRLDHEFTVPADIAEVWRAIVDPERVAPCMSGATLTGVDGGSFRGTVKVKLGPISLLYKGSGEFVDRDHAAGRIVIKASGKDSRGGGTAAATVTVTLTAEDGGTRATVATDLTVTGRPAQFGRGLISEVSGKILDSFAACLADRLAASPAEAPAPVGDPGAEPRPGAVDASPAAEVSQETPEATAEPPRQRADQAAEQPARSADAIDLLDYAGVPLTKRLLPVLAAAAGIALLIAVIRSLRR